MKKSTFQLFTVCGLVSTMTAWPVYDINASRSFETTPVIKTVKTPSTVNLDVDLQLGLVAYYPFSGNAIDASGNGHDASLDGATLVNDRHGNPNKAYKFTGKKNTLSFTGVKVKSPVLTISFWAKSQKKSEDILILKSLPGKLVMTVRKVNHKFELEFKISNKKVFIKDKNIYNDPNVFNFINIIYDGKEIRFMVNNQRAGELKLNINLLKSFFPYTLKEDPAFYSHVILDDIRVYSRVLNELELESLFAEAFTTPELSYETHIKIAVDSAEIYRTVLSDGGSPITKMGVCWNTTGNPDTSHNKTSISGHNGIYKTTMTGLLPNTKYYVRAYAVNEAGVGYSSEDFEFTTLPDLDYGTLTDIDGNVYRTVNIGSQTWMAENLRTTHYADGTPIEDGTNMLENPGKYYYVFLGDTMHKKIYGLLYSWEGATNSNPGMAHITGMQGTCPNGWHIPSYAEKEALLDFLGGSSVAAGKLKEVGEAHWDLPNESSNESGFTALGSGVKAMEEGVFGVFVDYRNLTYFWTSESYSNNVPGDPIYFAPVLQVNGSDSHYWSPAINYGAPVRCVKNNTNSYISIPEISTFPVADITSTSATAGGKVESDGKQFSFARGICWSTSPSPDTSDFKTLETDYKVTFSYSINGLTPNTTYYVRAYGITSAGISYGNEVNFTTEASSAINSENNSGAEQKQLLSNPLIETIAFDFYPNPASSVIHFRNLSENAVVTIYDSNGKILTDGNITNNILDVSSLATGVYYLKIYDNKNTVIKKLIKQ